MDVDLVLPRSLALSLILLTIYLISIKARNEGANLLYRFEFWPLLYSIFYCLLPVVFAKDIFILQRHSKSYCFRNAHRFCFHLHPFRIINLFLISPPPLISKFKLGNNQQTDLSYSQNRLHIASVSILFTLLFLLISFFLDPPSTSVASSMIFNYEESSLNANYRIIKNLAYLCIVVFPLLFHYRNGIIALVLSSLFVLIDLLHGYRTTAYIVLISYVVSLIASRHYKHVRDRIAKLLPLILFSLLTVAVFLRGKFLLEYNNFLIETFGEFFVTYIGGAVGYSMTAILPDPIESFGYTLIGFLPSFLRVEFFTNFKPVGEIIANNYGQGFGLGTSIGYEIYYYFGIVGIFAAPFVIHFMAIIFKVFSKYSQVSYVTNIALFAIVSRLFFRDGFIYHISFSLYLLGILSIFSFLMKKTRLIRP